MKIILATLLFTFKVLITNAYAGDNTPVYNWGIEESISKAKWILLENSVEVQDYKTAVKPLHWLLKNTPDLNVALYIYGAKILEKSVKTEKDAIRKIILEDSLLWLFDERIKHYGQEASVLNKKGKVAFKYLYNRNENEEQLFNLYKKIYSLNNQSMYIQNATNYFKSAIVLYKQSRIDKKQLVTAFAEMNTFLNKKQKVYPDHSKKKVLVGRTILRLSKLFKTNVQLSCKEIITYFENDYYNNPSLEKSKFLNSILLKNRCLDYKLFIETNNKLLESEPSADRFSVAAKLYLHNNNFAKASESFLKSLELETNDTIKSDIQLQLAKLQANKGDYLASKILIEKAIQLNTNNFKAYEFMGDLFLLGANQCKSNNILEQKGVYIAAYNMYKKANAKEKMKNTKNQFPTMEEIFVQNKEEGNVIKLNCWINKNITLVKK
jgi:tetratricopeptide (TPR) repeat protein